MEYTKYDAGRDICDELFKKTGDPRYHNMRVGFEDLKKENEKQQDSAVLEEEEFLGMY